MNYHDRQDIMLVHRVMDHLLSQVAVFQNGENGPNALPLVMQDSGMELKFELMVNRFRKVGGFAFRYIISLHNLTHLYRTRNRKYTNNDMTGGCSEELTERESCFGDGPDCPGR